MAGLGPPSPHPEDPSHQAPGLGAAPLALPQPLGGEKRKKTPHPQGRLGKAPEASGKEVSRKGGGASVCPSWGLTHAPQRPPKNPFLLSETFSLEKPITPLLPPTRTYYYLRLSSQEGRYLHIREKIAVRGQGLLQKVISPAPLTDTVSHSRPAPAREQAFPTSVSSFVKWQDHLCRLLTGYAGPSPALSSARPPKSGFSTSD